MRNISFDNPYWLLLLIPLAAGILVPYFIAINRDNKSRSAVTSLVLHSLIVVLVCLSLAGMVVTTVMTETHIYVVADLSHSASESLDEVDDTIAALSRALPKNAKLGVICFGKDYVLHTELGAPVTSVKTAQVDDSATDIASALKYAGSLFGEGVLKRVVLLTDGRETVSEDVSGMVSAVEQLAAQNVAIDALYLDSNLGADATEVQLTGVEYTASTYLDHETSADVLIQASTEMRAVLSLTCNGEKLPDRAVELDAGFNVVNLELSTAVAGSFVYELRLSAAGDESSYNNTYSFTQTVSADIHVLLITSQGDDVTAAEALFGENAYLDVHFVPNDPYGEVLLPVLQNQYRDHPRITVVEDPRTVPCSVEELCRYDEIVLANVDIRDIHNVPAFVESVEAAVAQYGKSLTTIGDTKIQNKSDTLLESLENMLPVKFGNSAQDPKLYTIVLDLSRSMFQASRFAVAKQAAIHLLNLLDDEDDVIVVTFAGDIDIVQPTTKAANREDIARAINAIGPKQGTSIGKSLAAAVNLMLEQPHDQKQIMLISDGRNYTAEIAEIEGKKMDPVEVAAYMADHDILLSTMNPYCQQEDAIRLMQSLAAAGGGNYYYVENESALSEVVFSDVADDLTESVIEKESLVHILRPTDEVMAGVAYLPSVMGYVHSRAKVSARTVLTVDYTKASGAVVEVPLYVYWSYGNGRVTSFTGAISGEWAASWQGTAGQTFLSNMIRVNVPEEKIDRPYNIHVSYDGIYSQVEILPAVLDPYAAVTIAVTHPDGTVTEEALSFDTSRYFYRFQTPLLGRYLVSVTYTTKTGEFTSESDFHLSYSPEYDRFANFDPATLHAAIRHRGTVSEGTLPDLSSNDDHVATYRLTFTVPFMIAAVALYVMDVIIRKIQWSDIRSLFKKTAQKQKR